MSHTLLAQIFARDPRKQARFPELPVDEALTALRRLEVVLRERQPAPPAAAAPGPEAGDAEELAVAFGGLATQIWRAMGKTVDPATGEPREEMKRVHRHIEGAMDVLKQMGLTINDWVNQPYDAGLPVKVLTFQPAPGVTRDTIVETVRPTVMWKNRLVQVGEVVVGTPAGSGEKP
jgi:antitoxin component of RelBE/YafQ-DinJ toxin-antitoxin module